MTFSASSPASRAFRLALLQQALVFPLVGGLILDGGRLLQVCVFAIVAFWGGVLVLHLRRRGHYTKLDLFLFRWGFLLLCVISFFLANWIWKLRRYPL